MADCRLDMQQQHLNGLAGMQILQQRMPRVWPRTVAYNLVVARQVKPLDGFLARVHWPFWQKTQLLLLLYCCCCCCFTTSSWENYSTWCRLSTVVGFAWSFLMNCNWICNKSHKRRQKRLAGKRQNNNNWLETVASSLPGRQTELGQEVCVCVCVCERNTVKCEWICMQMQD